MRKFWSITIDGHLCVGGNTDTDLNRKWAQAKAYVNKHGGVAQLISGRSMLLETYPNPIDLATLNVPDERLESSRHPRKEVSHD